MNMMEQETGDQKESGDGNLDFGTPTDDEEVTIPSHDRIKEVPDFPDTFRIHNEKTGCYQRSPGRGLAHDRPVGLPMEATGGAASRKPGQAPLLSPGRQILMEEEVITPPRGGGGGVRPLSLRVHYVGYVQYIC